MKIVNGQLLPSIDAEINGVAIDLSDVSRGSWTAVLFYRGHW